MCRPNWLSKFYSFQSYFDHQTSATSPAAGWSLTQPTSQVSSPFGILPHESVAAASPPGPPTTNSSTYDSNHYGVSHFNTNGTTDQAKTNAWSTESSKKNGDESPTYFQSAAAYDAEGLAYSPTNNTVAAHQSCIVTAPNVTTTNRVTQLPRAVVPTTIYLATNTQEKHTSVAGEFFNDAHELLWG